MRDEYDIQNLNPRDNPYPKGLEKQGKGSEDTGTEMTDDEKIDSAAARILEKYKPAFLELAK